eukprot:5368457-Alexandrium_andersonii.AAC.1
MAQTASTGTRMMRASSRAATATAASSRYRLDRSAPSSCDSERTGRRSPCCSSRAATSARWRA